METYRYTKLAFIFLSSKERHRLMEENEQLAALVEKVEKDKRSATDLLEKSERERKRISEKNAQLTINGMGDISKIY